MKVKEIESYENSLWKIFEKTGSITIYLLYKDIKKNNKKNKNLKIKK